LSFPVHYNCETKEEQDYDETGCGGGGDDDYTSNKYEQR
jgi:hypothetical protein